MTLERFVISRRYCGPPESGNGGYVCGRVAAAIGSAASVRLMAPPPLETELRIERSDGVAKLMHESNVIAVAKAASVDVAPPGLPSYAQAEAATGAYPGFSRHPFPRCFVCGPERAPGDGLRIFPGPVGADGLVASPWLPDASLTDGSGAVGPEFLWAALDCTSGFATLAVSEGKTIVLGELSARIDGRVSQDEKCILAGWPLHVDGRKRYAGAAVLRSSGELLALGRATWIEVPAGAFGGR